MVYFDKLNLVYIFHYSVLPWQHVFCAVLQASCTASAVRYPLWNYLLMCFSLLHWTTLSRTELNSKALHCNEQRILWQNKKLSLFAWTYSSLCQNVRDLRPQYYATFFCITLYKIAFYCNLLPWTQLHYNTNLLKVDRLYKIFFL